MEPQKTCTSEFSDEEWRICQCATDESSLGNKVINGGPFTHYGAVAVPVTLICCALFVCRHFQVEAQNRAALLQSGCAKFRSAVREGRVAPRVRLIFHTVKLQKCGGKPKH